MQWRPTGFIAIMAAVFLAACQPKNKTEGVFKGVYSFGPDTRSFKDCDAGREYWVTDQSKKLELQYSQMNVEKPYTPVYVEIEGQKLKSGKDGMGAEFDSTIVVTKVVKITKEIPQDMCN